MKKLLISSFCFMIAICSYAFSFSDTTANRESIARLNCVDNSSALKILEMKLAGTPYSVDFLSSVDSDSEGIAVQIFNNKISRQEIMVTDTLPPFVSFVSVFPQHYEQAKINLYSNVQLILTSENSLVMFTFWVLHKTKTATYTSIFFRSSREYVGWIEDLYEKPNTKDRKQIKTNKQKKKLEDVYINSTVSVLNKKIFIEPKPFPYTNHTRQIKTQELSNFKICQINDKESWIYCRDKKIAFSVHELQKGEIMISTYINEKLSAQTVCFADYIVNIFPYKRKDGTQICARTGYSETTSMYDIFLEERKPGTNEKKEYGYQCTASENPELKAFVFVPDKTKKK